MPNEPIVLTLPLPPLLTNGAHGRSRHWRALEREKKAYWATLDLLRWTKRLPPPPPEPLERAEVSAALYLWNLMDDDGAMARLKWPLDWLKRRGYIRDDRRKYLHWTGIPEQEIDRANQRLELTLTPIPPPSADASARAARPSAGRRRASPARRG